MGAALSLFTDFFTHTTGPAYLSGPEDVINDAQLRNYEAFDALSRAKKDVQGGASIKDMILLDDPLTAGTYKAGDQASVANVQGGNTVTVDWRFCRVPVVWNEKEILLNTGGGGMAGRFHQYKKLKAFKYQQAYTSKMNKIENLNFAAASNSAMESTSGQEPYSILASLTKDGLAPAGFTTIQGINPTTSTKWRNQTAEYTASTPFDTDAGIVGGFDEISQLVKFKKPSYSPEMAKFSDSKFEDCVILTNREGRTDYMKSLRANNDITRAGPQDQAYGQPVFLGVPVRNCESMDEQGTFSSASGPGYLFLNMPFFTMVFHSEKWMDKSPPLVFPDKPDTVVVWCDTYYNLFCRSRQRQGYLQAT